MPVYLTFTASPLPSVTANSTVEPAPRTTLPWPTSPPRRMRVSGATGVLARSAGM
ncbi:hypothetical protein EV132_1123 [Rhizobium sullae]|uniref:Uncharacterized protein n=1 Tax=Rhizobium sullae TaxID=50338 RepID=A0A4V2V8H5_RHISU|nr:hypothetical protein EV132_1123 [Rhizobium sullae]